MSNLTDELSTAKERRLNQFGTAVLVWCGKSVKFDRVCRTFVELNLGSTHGAPSESDVVPVSLQSWTYSVRFGTWKVRLLNQALNSSNNAKYLKFYCRKFHRRLALRFHTQIWISGDWQIEPHSQVLSPSRWETVVGSGHLSPRIWEVTNKQFGGGVDKCESVDGKCSHETVYQILS